MSLKATSETLRKNQAEKGGSYYADVLTKLKEMKKAGASNSEASQYLVELVNEGFLSVADQSRLYNKYRDNKIN